MPTCNGEGSGLKKLPPPLWVKLVASLTALAALGSSIFAKVDPVNCLLRGAIAFVAGRALAGLWCALFTSGTVGNSGEPESDSLQAADVERANQVAA